MIKNELITIQSHEDITTTLKLSKMGPNLSITSQVNLQNKPKVQKFHESTKELDFIQKQLKAIKDSALPTQQMTYHHHGFIIGYIAITIIVCLMSRLLWSKCRRKQKNSNDLELNQRPIPMPRQQPSCVTEC